MSLQEVIYPYGSHHHLNVGILTAGEIELTAGGSLSAPNIACDTLAVSGLSSLNGVSNVGNVASTTLGVSGASTLAGVSASSLLVSGASTLAGVSASSLSVSGASTLAAVNCASVTATGNVGGATLSSSGNTTVGGFLNVTGQINSNGISDSGGVGTTVLSASAPSFLSGIVNVGNVSSNTYSSSGLATLDSLTVSNAASVGTSLGVGTTVSAQQYDVGLQLASLEGVLSQNPAESITLTNISATNLTLGLSPKLQFVRVYDNVQVYYLFTATATATANAVVTYELPASMVLANYATVSDAYGIALLCDAGTGLGVSSACISSVVGQKQITFTLPVVNTTVYSFLLQFSSKVGRA